ncbi:MAG: VOC family protein [Dehalococcoidales bacterium]|nr:VOC family protein [Dehalococcoidales bacterium]
MVNKIDHIGIVVKDADEALKAYTEMFGFEVVEEMGGPGGEFKAVLIRAGDITLEFLQPLTDEGSFAKFLKERGGGLHHVSFATNNIENDLKALKAQGRKLLNEEPMSLPSAKIAFIHPEAAENVLIELVQRSHDLPDYTVKLA